MRVEAVVHLRAVVARAAGHDVVEKPLRRGQPLECDAAFFRTVPGDADVLHQVPDEKSPPTTSILNRSLDGLLV